MPKDSSRRYHDRVARRYDAIYDDPYWHYHDELTWRQVKAHLPRDAAAPCADLGCGTGKWGLKLLKSGFATTFLDSSANMVEQVRQKLDGYGPRAKRATLVVGDIVRMPDLPSDHFALLLAMGDPLSICSDPHAAALEMARVTRAGGHVIATADNKLAALDHFAEKGDLDALEQFVRRGKTRWLTRDKQEQFELTMFTSAGLKKLFEQAGFEVLRIDGKPLLPVRKHSHLLQTPQALPRLLRMEEELSRDPAAAATASHLQVVARKP